MHYRINGQTNNKNMHSYSNWRKPICDISIWREKINWNLSVESICVQMERANIWTMWFSVYFSIGPALAICVWYINMKRAVSVSHRHEVELGHMINIMNEKRKQESDRKCIHINVTTYSNIFFSIHSTVLIENVLFPQFEIHNFYFSTLTRTPHKHEIFLWLLLLLVRLLQLLPSAALIPIKSNFEWKWFAIYSLTITISIKWIKSKNSKMLIEQNMNSKWKCHSLKRKKN